MLKCVVILAKDNYATLLLNLCSYLISLNKEMILPNLKMFLVVFPHDLIKLAVVALA